MTVCTENLNQDVMVMALTKDRELTITVPLRVGS
jgi:hypothetical protein